MVLILLNNKHCENIARRIVMAEDTNKTNVPPTAESVLDAEKKALAEAEAKAAQAQAAADELKAKIAAKEQRIVDREESEIRYNNYVGYGVLAGGAGIAAAGLAAVIYALKS